MNKYNLKTHLEKLYKLLEEEKNALVEDKGEKIQAIVEEKGLLIEGIQESSYEISENDIEILAMKEEIDSMQELNLLLTKQALSYQQAMLESIAKNVQNLSKTYSNTGQYKEAESINLVNQKV